MRAMASLLAAALVVGLAGCKQKKGDTNSGGQSANSGNPGGPPQGGNTGSGASNGNNVGVIPAGGVGVVTNPGAVAGGGGGGGAAGAVRKAADRTKVRAAIADLRLTIDGFSLSEGRMPTPQETYAIVKQAAPAYAKFIEDGQIVLNPAKSREEVWAYEGKPPYGVYMVLTSQGVEDMDAQALRTRLGIR